MIPKAHIIHYNGKAIYYENYNGTGLYKVEGLPDLTFLRLDDAFKEIDKDKFFDNLKQANDQSRFSEKIQK